MSSTKTELAKRVEKSRLKKKSEDKKKVQEEEARLEKVARTRFISKGGFYVHQATGTLVLHPTRKVIIGKIGTGGKLEQLTSNDVKLCKKYRFYYENVEKPDSNNSNSDDSSDSDSNRWICNDSETEVYMTRIRYQLECYEPSPYSPPSRTSKNPLLLLLDSDSEPEEFKDEAEPVSSIDPDSDPEDNPLHK